MRRRELLIHLSLCGALAAVGPTFAAHAAMGSWFIFLEAGRKTPDDKSLVEAMQRGHVGNFKRLRKLGRVFGNRSTEHGFSRPRTYLADQYPLVVGGQLLDRRLHPAGFRLVQATCRS